MRIRSQQFQKLCVGAGESKRVEPPPPRPDLSAQKVPRSELRELWIVVIWVG